MCSFFCKHGGESAVQYQRILLKLSGEAMGSKAEGVLDFAAVDQIALQIKAVVSKGVQIGIVVGGGNIWRGRSSGAMERNRADHMGMLATTINALALQDSLEQIQVPCRVLSAVSMERFCDTFSARFANQLLDQGVVVIFACGTGSPFFSTDTAAALRAAEIHADALLLAKNVDAIYSADPKLDPNAVRYTKLTYREVIERQLRATDLTAITLCQEENIPIVVFGMKETDSIALVTSGADIGTVIGRE